MVLLSIGAFFYSASLLYYPRDFGTLLTVIPAKAGIEKFLIVLNSGSRFLQRRITLG